MAAIVQYDDSSNEEDEIAEPISDKNAPVSATKPIENVPYIPPKSLISSSLISTINSTPEIIGEEKLNAVIPMDPTTKELSFNPRFDQMYTPVAGPQHPFKSAQQAALKNTLTGYVEEGHISNFQFEVQRRTFDSYGFAQDPSEKASTSTDGIIGDTDSLEKYSGVTVFEANKKRPGDSRKRCRNNDASDIGGFLGPWGKFVDEKEVAVPSEEDKLYLEEYLSKKSKNKKRPDDTPVEEKSTLHISDKDFMGRSFMNPPQDAGVNFRPDSVPKRCYIPKNLLHEYSGAHAKGVSTVRLFPVSGHLMLSGGMDDKIKLWELYGKRRLIRSYNGHRQAIKDLAFNNSGSQFMSSSYDRSIKLWDTETGQCVQRMDCKKAAICLKFNPDEDKNHLCLAGCNDKKILCFDTRSGEIVQEYDRHLGPVNTITFVDQNRRFVSTSDDKSLRVWEWDIPVDFKYLADPSMQSMPIAHLSPNGKYLICQSHDNQIVVFNALGSFKRVRKKSYKGHMVAGYACELDLSPDLTYLISGDGEGKLFCWDFKSTRCLTRWQAHSGPCVSCAWLPHETSKVVTAGWDGVIKLWD